MSEKSSSNGGMGFVEGLQLLFIGFKLANIINWSWWWVLSPIWIGIIVLLICAIIVAAMS